MSFRLFLAKDAALPRNRPLTDPRYYEVTYEAYLAGLRLLMPPAVANVYKTALPEPLPTDAWNRGLHEVCSPAQDAPSRVPGISVPLVAHQRETVGWLLRREDEGTQLVHRVTTPTGAAVHVDGLFCHHGVTVTPPGRDRWRGGVLADAMGLGKTVSLLTLIVLRPAPTPLPSPKHHKATLVCLPVTLVGQWEMECEKIAPGLKYYRFYGKKRSVSSPAFLDADVVFTTIHTVRSETTRNQLSGFTFHRVIYDEFHLMLHQVRELADWLRAERSWLSSGTPTANGFDDIEDAVAWCMLGACGEAVPPHALGFSERFRSTREPYATTRSRGLRHGATFRAVFPQEAEQFLPCEQQAAKFLDKQHRRGPQAPHPRLLAELPRIVFGHRKSVLDGHVALPPRAEIAHRFPLLAAERQAYALVQAFVTRYHDGLSTGARVANFGALAALLHALRAAASGLLLQESVLANDRSGERNAAAALAANFNVRVVTVAEAAASVFGIGGHGNPDTLKELAKKLQKVPPETNECILCLDDLSRPTVLRCGHVFCFECLKGLITADTKDCPLCRKPTVSGLKHELLAVDPLAALAANDNTGERGHGRDADAEAALSVKNLREARAALASVRVPSRVSACVALIQRLCAEANRQEAAPAAAQPMPPKFVVFTTMPQLLRQLEKALREAALQYCTIEGGTPMPERAKLVKAFQDPKNSLQVALLSSRAGSAGLTLTAANHLIFVEPMTNVGQAEQAAARIYRFGQTRAVTIHRLLAEDTVDTRLQDLLDSGTLTAQGLERFHGVASTDSERRQALPQMAYLLSNHPLPAVPEDE
ncbi:MAG: SNF2-related protein [Vicinamibacterales bacterium]